MILSIYRKLKRLTIEKIKPFTESKYALPFVFFIGLIEAIIFPFPQEIFMIPMMASNRTKIFLIATFSIIGSACGAIIAYFIGMFFFEALGKAIIDVYNFNHAFNETVQNVNEHGFLFVFLGGFTPLPYKVFTLTSGFLGVNFFIFLLASIFSRSLRFYLIGFIIWKYGAQIMENFEKRFYLFSSLIFALVVVSYFIFKTYV